MRAFHTFLLNSDMMAYLAMMAPRLIELHRVLKVTGSIYLHCDPTASHYLKMLMDAVFGATNYRNQIIWKRSHAHSDGKQGRKAYGNVSDVLLFYTVSDDYTFNTQYTPYSKEYVDKYFRYVDENGRRYWLDNLTGPGGAAKGNPYYEVMGVSRYWRYSKVRMQALIEAGRIVQSKPGNVPQYKRYLDDTPGIPLQNIWTDIPPINMMAKERLGYPTQKPEVLLERVVKTSSNEGDIVLDPFCGCGTAIAASHKLNRHWIGIDVTHLAVGLIKNRLQTAFGPEVSKAYDVIGEPTDLASSKVLAEQDRFQFQAWALGLVGARTAHSNKKGSDRGIDGKLFFRDDAQGELKQIILSVKSGGVQVRDVRDLVGTIEREKAELGVLITLEEPSKPMLREAVDAGFYKSPSFKDQVPRIQIRTIEELLAGGGIQYPRLVDVTFKPAPKAKAAAAENLYLNLSDPE
jgi:DNA modification methylase